MRRIKCVVSIIVIFISMMLCIGFSVRLEGRSIETSGVSIQNLVVFYIEIGH